MRIRTTAEPIARSLLGLVMGTALLHAPAWGESGNPDKGQAVFVKNCSQCHGARGKGDGPLAESLSVKPADLTSEKVMHASDEALLNAIRNGKPGTAMPAWKGDLSDQAILDVLAYARTLSH